MEWLMLTSNGRGGVGVRLAGGRGSCSSTRASTKDKEKGAVEENAQNKRC